MRPHYSAVGCADISIVWLINVEKFIHLKLFGLENRVLYDAAVDSTLAHTVSCVIHKKYSRYKYYTDSSISVTGVQH